MQGVSAQWQEVVSMSNGDIFQAAPSERIAKLKARLLNAEAEMCIDRAILVTEAYKTHEAQPVIVKRALALKKILENIPLYIEPDVLIVGSPASKPRSAEVFPELSVHWMVRELDNFETRGFNRLKVSDKIKRLIRTEIYPYWKGKSVCDHLEAVRSSCLQQAVDCGLISNTHQWAGFAHVALSFYRPLGLGYQGLCDIVREKRSGLDLAAPDYLKHKNFYDAAEIICCAVISYAKRYSELALDMAKNETDPRRKAELEKISAVCERVPALPARNFYEAIQAVWFVQLVPQIETNGFSITPGRFDQYMYSFYARDVELGALTQAESQELLECYWLKCNEILRVDDQAAAEINAGYAVGQNLVVGGVDASGADATNALSYMCLLANEHVGLTQPNFTVRLHNDSPARFLERVTEVIAGGNGMPQVLNDEVIIPGLQRHGIDLETAREYIPVGCDEISVDGMWGRCNGGYLNFAKILESMLNDGKCALIERKTGLSRVDIAQLNTFECFKTAYLEQVKEGCRILVSEANTTDIIHERLLPLPSVSVVVAGCLENGLDVTQGGARYNFTGPVGVGAASVGDSLAAIKQMVYDDSRIELAQFARILQNNYKGEEVIRQFIRNRIQKFGNDIDGVDDLVVALTNTFFDELENHTNPRGGGFTAALYSVTAQISMGNKTGATPDGRLARQPLSDGLSPGYGCDVSGPTAALKSVAKIDLKRAIDGVIVNQRLSPSVLKTAGGREKFKDLLRAFVTLGGFHWQFNVISTDVLKDAQVNPADHGDLVVRVAGYSALFTALSPRAQESIIARTAAEL
jgi:pyruvate formate-lyase/glycerol dehydratase family glycyl radical enzyme